MSELLIARIARRAANQETQIDVRGLSRQSPAAPLRRADAEASERELGFPIPELLKLVYEKVGNGGFGPGYGLMGIRSGATDDQGQKCHRCLQELLILRSERSVLDVAGRPVTHLSLGLRHI